MNYWFLYNLTDGSIYGTPYLGLADAWTNIPPGCAALGPIASITSDPTVKDAYTHPGYYTVQDSVLTPVSGIESLRLADALTSIVRPPTTPDRLAAIEAAIVALMGV